MVRKINMLEALQESAKSTRSVITQSETETTPQTRKETKPITVHFPPQVRHQLKMLAAEQNRTMEDMIGEALNNLFAAYGRAEIAPRASLKSPQK